MVSEAPSERQECNVPYERQAQASLFSSSQSTTPKTNTQADLIIPVVVATETFHAYVQGFCFAQVLLPTHSSELL